MQMSSQIHAAAALSPEKKPGISWIDGWLGRTVGLEILEKRFFPLPGFEPLDHPDNRLVTIPTTVIS